MDADDGAGGDARAIVEGKNVFIFVPFAEEAGMGDIASARLVRVGHKVGDAHVGMLLNVGKK